MVWDDILPEQQEITKRVKREEILNTSKSTLFPLLLRHDVHHRPSLWKVICVRQNNTVVLKTVYHLVTHKPIVLTVVPRLCSVMDHTCFVSF